MTTTTMSDPALMLRSMFASTHRAARFFPCITGQKPQGEIDFKLSNVYPFLLWKD